MNELRKLATALNIPLKKDDRIFVFSLNKNGDLGQFYRPGISYFNLLKNVQAAVAHGREDAKRLYHVVMNPTNLIFVHYVQKSNAFQFYEANYNPYLFITEQASQFEKGIALFVKYFTELGILNILVESDVTFNGFMTDIVKILDDARHGFIKIPEENEREFLFYELLHRVYADREKDSCIYGHFKYRPKFVWYL